MGRYQQSYIQFPKKTFSSIVNQNLRIFPMNEMWILAHFGMRSPPFFKPISVGYVKDRQLKKKSRSHYISDKKWTIYTFEINLVNVKLSKITRMHFRRKFRTKNSSDHKFVIVIFYFVNKLMIFNWNSFCCCN